MGGLTKITIMYNTLSTLSKSLAVLMSLSMMGLAQSTQGDQELQMPPSAPQSKAVLALPTKSQLKQINQGNWEVLKQYLGVDVAHVFVCCLKSEYKRDLKHPKNKGGVVYQFCKVVSSTEKNILAGDVIILPTGVEGKVDLAYSYPTPSLLYVFNPSVLDKELRTGNILLSADTIRLALQQGGVTARMCQIVKVMLNKQAGHSDYQ